MSRRVLVLSLLTSTLVGTEALQESRAPTMGGEVIAVGLTPAAGYAAARYMRTGPFLEVALTAGGAERGATVVAAMLRGVRVGGSTGRIFGFVGMFGGAAIGAL
jgi:hypothetical protein